MNQLGKRRRYVYAALCALPITAFLFFIMTRLILPADSDPVVTGMIRNIELRRAERQDDSVTAPPAELPELYTDTPAVPTPNPDPPTATEQTQPTQQEDTTPSANESAEPGSLDAIDWWAEAENFTQGQKEEFDKQWLLDNGYVPYVSTMQGAFPSSPWPQVSSTGRPEIGVPYTNTFGDTEIQISEYCFAYSQVDSRPHLGLDNIGKYLPMIFFCKKEPKPKFDFAME